MPRHVIDNRGVILPQPEALDGVDNARDEMDRSAAPAAMGVRRFAAIRGTSARGGSLGLVLAIAGIPPAFAQEAPLWTFDALQPTTIVLPADAEATTSYRVTNQSAVPRTLTMVPIAGVEAIATGAGHCSLPFSLAPEQSCVLALRLIGSQIAPEGIHGGPVICRATGSGAPDPLLCYQPSAAQQLNVTLAPPEQPVLVLAPDPLRLAVGARAALGVSHIGGSTAALDIVIDIPPDSGLTLVGSTCPPSLSSGAACDFTVEAIAPAGPSVLTVQGSNTDPVSAHATVIELPFAITPNSLLFAVDAPCPPTPTPTKHRGAMPCPSAAATVAVTNLGSVPVDVGALAIEGDNAGAFVLQNDLCSGQALAGEATCGFDVLFAPATPGDFAAHVAVPWSAAFAVPMQEIPVLGTVDRLFADGFEP